MFSGIVQATGKVLAAGERGAVRAVRIKKPRGWKLALGQSINIDGICSTVMKQGVGFFEVEYMPETLRKTTAGEFTEERLLNLERSLTLRDYLDGHLVMGHVDARGIVARVEKKGNVALVTIDAPAALSALLALHGSVAINGVSLTIARKKGNAMTLSLVPYTLGHTNLGRLVAGDRVNIEADVMARYVFAALEKNGTIRPHAKKRSSK